MKTKSLVKNVDVCDDQIEILDSVKYLGAFLDKNHSSFKGHINKKCQAAMVN